MANRLRSEVLNGRYKPGDTIGSESELCGRFGVSRGSVRQALDALVKERLIYRLAGRGTFVSETSPPVKTRSSVRGLEVGVFVDVPPGMQGCGFILEMIEGFQTAGKVFYPRCDLSFEFHEFTRELGLNFLNRGNRDGFLFVPMGGNCLEFLATLRPESAGPVVIFFREAVNSRINQFFIDHAEGAYLATDYLLRLGHRRVGIVLVSPIEERVDSRSRYEGYFRAYRRANLEVDSDLVAQTDLSAAGVTGAVEAMLNHRDRPTALMIGGQALVNPTLRVMREMNLQTPGELSVVAFDDATETHLHDPPLTVVKQPFARGTRLALERLIAQIMGSAADPVSVALIPELIVRESTGEPK